MRGFGCEAHKHVDRIPQESHHVWPLGYHGPNTADNRLIVCANAHSDTHYLLEILLKHKDYEKRQYGAGVRKLAQRGYDAVMAYGDSLTPPSAA